VRSAKTRLRAWTNWFLTERRRLRLAWRTPAVPVILSAVTQWDASVVGWADVQLTLAFNHGPWPVATLDVFCIIDGGEEGPVGTVASTATSFTHGSVAQGESSLSYRARYRNGGVIGPVSAWFPYDISLP
jgi:hypothetical protein